MNQKQSRVFTIPEQFRNIYNGAKAFVLLKKNRKHRLITKSFKERIMLAITEVNGCIMCSYVHTKIALNSGIPKDNIQLLLQGDTTKVPSDEVIGVLFGQHFADSKEHPDNKIVHRIINEYGFQKAELVLAACNMITMMNGMGISLDDFTHRLRFKKNKKSNILIEIFNPLATIIIFPTLIMFNYLIALFTPIKLLRKQYQYTS